MESRYIDGVDIPKYDATLTEALMEDAAQPGAGGMTMVIAVENISGEVYRIFEATGLGELMAATKEMELMDFTDVLFSHGSASK